MAGLGGRTMHQPGGPALVCISGQTQIHCLGCAQCPLSIPHKEKGSVEHKLYSLKLGNLGKLLSLFEPQFPYL